MNKDDILIRLNDTLLDIDDVMCTKYLLDRYSAYLALSNIYEELSQVIISLDNDDWEEADD